MDILKCSEASVWIAGEEPSAYAISATIQNPNRLTLALLRLDFHTGPVGAYLGLISPL